MSWSGTGTGTGMDDRRGHERSIPALCSMALAPGRGMMQHVCTRSSKYFVLLLGALVQTYHIMLLLIRQGILVADGSFPHKAS